MFDLTQKKGISILSDQKNEMVVSVSSDEFEIYDLKMESLKVVNIMLRFRNLFLLMIKALHVHH